jgi:hypothetical protein
MKRILTTKEVQKKDKKIFKQIMKIIVETDEDSPKDLALSLDRIASLLK